MAGYRGLEVVVRSSCVILQELREPAPLEVVVDIGWEALEEVANTYLRGGLGANGISCQITANRLRSDGANITSISTMSTS